MTEVLSTNYQRASLISRDTWQCMVAEANGITEAPFSHILKPLGIIEEMDADTAYEAMEYLVSSIATDEAVDIGTHIQEIRKKTMERIGPTYEGEDLESALRLQVMSDAKVRQFVSRDLSEQQESLKEIWPEFETVIMSGVQNGIDQGYVPEVVASRLTVALGKTAVRIMDPVISESEGYVACYTDRTDEIRITGEENDIENLIHEFVHKIAGGTFWQLPNGTPTRNRGGFSTFTAKGYTKVDLDEAVTQHLSRAILDGDFETFDPDEREDDDHIYYHARKAVATFIDRSGGRITSKSLIGAFFEDTEPGGMRKARKALVQMVTEAYGHHAISSFAKLFDACDDIDGYEFEKLFAQEILGAICPPVINQAGSIERTGYIDVEGVRSSIQKRYPDVVNLNEAFARAECEYLGVSMSSNA